MIIRIPLRFGGNKAEKMLYTLFDSGATHSCITEEIAELITKPHELLEPMRLMAAKDDVSITVTTSSRLDFYYEDFRFRDEFLIVPGLSEDVIIGADIMQRWNLKLDFEKNIIVVDPRAAKSILINLMQPSSLRSKI